MDFEAANAEAGVSWLFSFLSADRHRTYCLYEAPSPDAILAAAKQSGADAVVLWTIPRFAAQIVKEMAKVGYRPTIVSSYVNNDPTLFRLTCDKWDQAQNKCTGETLWQGALIAATQRTSDYWQGDEAKWQRSFAGGAGSEFIDRFVTEEGAFAPEEIAALVDRTPFLREGYELLRSGS